MTWLGDETPRWSIESISVPPPGYEPPEGGAFRAPACYARGDGDYSLDAHGASVNEPMTKDELELISPAEAKEMDLDARKNEVSQSTLDGYHYRLKHVNRWCQEVEGIEKLNNLTGRKLHQFETLRRDDGGLNPITLQGQLDASWIRSQTSEPQFELDVSRAPVAFDITCLIHS